MEEGGESRLLAGQGRFLWTGHGPVFPPIPPCLGLLPYFLDFLLFWFNKTKSGSLAGRDGGRASRPHPNHHPVSPPPAPEPSSSWGSHSMP